jgi:hypothetical protein
MSEEEVVVIFSKSNRKHTTKQITNSDLLVGNVVRSSQDPFSDCVVVKVDRAWNRCTLARPYAYQDLLGCEVILYESDKDALSRYGNVPTLVARKVEAHFPLNYRHEYILDKESKITGTFDRVKLIPW